MIKHLLPAALFLAVFLLSGCVNIKADKPLVDFGSFNHDDQADGDDYSPSPSATTACDDLRLRYQRLQKELARCRKKLARKEEKNDKLEKKLDKCEDKIERLEDTIEDIKD